MLLPFLSLYYRSGLRGSYRLTRMLSKLIPLSDVPVQTFYGDINVDLRTASGRDALVYTETPEALEMKRHLESGFVCYDVGAHWGIYSALMARYGRTFAFEANSRIYPSLRKTAKRIGFAALNVALSDENGEAKFYVPEESSMASLYDWTAAGGRDAGRVAESICTMRRLDDLGLPAPDFIKIDVEGAELRVLKGATETLKSRPILYVEVMPLDYSRDELLALLPGYRMFRGGEEVSAIEGDYSNIVFLPAEKCES